MRILHIINGVTLGGAETLLYRLASRDRTNEHAVVSLLGPAWYSDAFADAGIEIHHLDMNSLSAVPKGLVRLNRIIRESGADVVQCWMYRSNLLGGVLARAAGKPVVWGIHCSTLAPLRPSSRALAYLGGFLARWTPDFVINCSAQSAKLHEKLGFSAAEGAVVHNGYDASAFFPDADARAATRSALAAGPDEFLIGNIARWHAQKDIPNLLAAVRIAHDRGIPLRCLLMGADLGPENPDLTSAIERAGCSGFVVPLGPRSDIQDIARALDLHVLASCGSEAFPNVVAETMLSGTPNAVTDVGDAALMVGDTGFVVPPSDPQRLAAAIEDAHAEWRTRPEAWQERRAAARERIANNFSFERMIEGYQDAWNKVTEGRGSPR